MLIPIDPKDFERMLRAAIDCYSRGDNPQAETILIGLTALGSDDPRPYKALGSLLFLQGRDLEAAEAYTEALERDPVDPYTLVALAELKLQGYQIDAAVDYLERLFALPGSDVHPAANRGRRIALDFHQRLTHTK